MVFIVREPTPSLDLGEPWKGRKLPSKTIIIFKVLQTNLRQSRRETDIHFLDISERVGRFVAFYNTHEMTPLEF